MNAIEVRGLGKKYAIGVAWQPIELREILSSPRNLLRRRARSEEFWALRDLSLDIREGKVTGIIGRNGAGKSTLLKILSRITEPSTGRAFVYGSLASLLEVGTGFHPELTGRENIFLNGAILGMGRREIRAKFDQIVDFAEIGALLDTPVKRYSSGMYVRLAFAVAAHLEPRILLVDEVLAVGDAAFQRRCVGKMGELGRSGRTVVVVSHNMSLVSNLCDEVVWIDRGEVLQQGHAGAVIARYLSAGAEDAAEWSPSQEAGTGFVFRRVRVVGGSQGGDHFAADEHVALTFDYSVTRPIPPSRIGFLLRAEDGTNVLESHSSDDSPTLNASFAPGTHRSRVEIPGGWLRPGRYFVTVAEPNGEAPIVHESVVSFTITEQNSPAARDGRAALLVPVLKWQTESIE